jgi:hypothetical protein
MGFDAERQIARLSLPSRDGIRLGTDRPLMKQFAAAIIRRCCPSRPMLSAPDFGNGHQTVATKALSADRNRRRSCAWTSTRGLDEKADTPLRTAMLISIFHLTRFCTIENRPLEPGGPHHLQRRRRMVIAVEVDRTVSASPQDRRRSRRPAQCSRETAAIDPDGRDDLAGRRRGDAFERGPRWSHVLRRAARHRRGFCPTRRRTSKWLAPLRAG